MWPSILSWDYLYHSYSSMLERIYGPNSTLKIGLQGEGCLRLYKEVQAFVFRRCGTSLTPSLTRSMEMWGESVVRNRLRRSGWGRNRYRRPGIDRREWAPSKPSSDTMLKITHGPNSTLKTGLQGEGCLRLYKEVQAFVFRQCGTSLTTLSKKQFIK